MMILATLVLPGLSLTPLIRPFDLEQDRTLEQKEAHAREQAATAALARLDELSTESWPLAAQINRLCVRCATIGLTACGFEAEHLGSLSSIHEDRILVRERFRP